MGVAAERRAGEGALQVASWENPVTNLLKAASEALQSCSF